MNDDWPFEDPKNVAVVTLRQILEDGLPILLVTHDEEDGGWQFLTGSGDLDVEEARVVSLAYICKRDPGVLQLADMPAGWRAWRTTADDAWQRGPKPAA